MTTHFSLFQLDGNEFILLVNVADAVLTLTLTTPKYVWEFSGQFSSLKMLNMDPGTHRRLLCEALMSQCKTTQFTYELNDPDDAKDSKFTMSARLTLNVLKTYKTDFGGLPVSIANLTFQRSREVSARMSFFNVLRTIQIKWEDSERLALAMRQQCESLQCERNALKLQLDEAASLKQGLEEEWLDRFLSLLNTKKAQLLQLTEENQKLQARIASLEAKANNLESNSDSADSGPDALDNYDKNINNFDHIANKANTNNNSDDGQAIAFDHQLSRPPPPSRSESILFSLGGLSPSQTTDNPSLSFANPQLTGSSLVASDSLNDLNHRELGARQTLRTSRNSSHSLSNIKPSDPMARPNGSFPSLSTNPNNTYPSRASGAQTIPTNFSGSRVNDREAGAAACLQRSPDRPPDTDFPSLSLSDSEEPELNAQNARHPQRAQNAYSHDGEDCYRGSDERRIGKSTVNDPNYATKGRSSTNKSSNSSNSNRINSRVPRGAKAMVRAHLLNIYVCA
jgi:hypothetical protein